MPGVIIPGRPFPMLNAALMTEEKIPSCWAGPRDGHPGRAAAQCGRKPSDWAGLYGGAHLELGRGPTETSAEVILIPRLVPLRILIPRLHRWIWKTIPYRNMKSLCPKEHFQISRPAASSKIRKYSVSSYNGDPFTICNRVSLCCDLP